MFYSEEVIHHTAFAEIQKVNAFQNHASLIQTDIAYGYSC